MRCFWFCNKCPPFSFNAKRHKMHTPSGPCVCSLTYVLLAEDACAQCWMLDCTIPTVSTGEAVIRSCLRRERALLCCSDALHSSPFCRVSPSFSLICSLPASRWGWSEACGIASHCSPRRQTDLNQRHTAELSLSLFFPSSCFNAYTGGIYRMHACSVTCPSMFTPETDLPESPLPSHCHSSLSSACTHLDFTDCHWRGKRETHRITRMGFYGTLKMIFYKVSKLSGCINLQHIPVSYHPVFDSLCRPHYLWRASRGRLHGHCGGCTRRFSSSPETAL